MTPATDFFYRFDGLGLVPGNKAAGFVAYLDTSVLQRLRAIPMTGEEYQTLTVEMHARVQRSGLVKKSQVSCCGFALVPDTACPLMFTTDPVFGASVGADPNELLHLSEVNPLAWLGPTVAYTPHNADTPAQALVLMVLVATWGEWAFNRLALLALEKDRESQVPPALVELYVDDDIMTVAEYRKYEEQGAYNDDDGDAYYATSGGVSRIPVNQPCPAWATHVVFYGK